MTDHDPDDAQVTYTVKELLGQIKKDQATGFTEIKASLDGKASKVDVARMEARLDGHTKDIGDLQQRMHDREVAANVHRERDQRALSTRDRAILGLKWFVGIVVAILGPYLAIHL